MPRIEATAAASKPGAAIPAQAAPEQFGLDLRQNTLESVESRFDGTFEGWNPRDKIRLSNGQVWQVVDGSSTSVYLKSPKILVRRGALGAYFLDVEGLNRSARVKRVE
jgi:hypothetical protein